MSASCIWLTGNYMAVTSMARGMNLCWARTLQHSVFQVSNIKGIFSKSNYCYWLKDEWWAVCSYYNPQLLWQPNVTLRAGQRLCLVNFKCPFMYSEVSVHFISMLYKLPLLHCSHSYWYFCWGDVGLLLANVSSCLHIIYRHTFVVQLYKLYFEMA